MAIIKFDTGYYATTATRVSAMREVCEFEFQIETELLSLNETGVLFKASIKDSEGKVIATGHRYCVHGAFGNAIEQAETQAVGRALAFFGYGTQDVLKEQTERLSDLADSPVPMADDGKSEEAKKVAALLNGALGKGYKASVMSPLTTRELT